MLHCRWCRGSVSLLLLWPSGAAASHNSLWKLSALLYKDRGRKKLHMRVCLMWPGDWGQLQQLQQSSLYFFDYKNAVCACLRVCGRGGLQEGIPRLCFSLERTKHTPSPGRTAHWAQSSSLYTALNSSVSSLHVSDVQFYDAEERWRA